MSSSIPTEEEDDDSAFFETFDRIPSSVSFDFNLASSSSDSDEDDSRLSFASAIATPSLLRRTFDDVVIDEEEEEEDEGKGGVDYSIWMADPMSIEERRQRLLKGMGISLSRSSFCTVSPRSNGRLSNCGPLPSALSTAVCFDTQTRRTPSVFSRSRSDVGVFGGGRNSTPSSPALVRAPSAPPSFCHPKSDDDLFTDPKKGKPNCRRTASLRIRKGSAGGGSSADNLPQRGNITRRSDTVALYTIKNLDTGKEFVINLENGTWNSKLSDLQTGNQLTMDEFERSVGYSPIVKELMRRENVIGLSSNGNGNGSGNLQRSMKRTGKKKGVKWLKNIKGVASSVTGHMLEKEGSRSNSSVSGKCNSSLSSSHSDWMKVHMRGKPFKELTGMYMSQEINAHQGSIWCMRFSPDALFMASAGEDRVVHVWQVLECDSVSSSQRPIDDQNSTYLPPVVNGSLDGSASADVSQSQRLKRGKTFSSKRENSIPDYVVVPETIFSLSEKPFCSFQGHLDDVLDLSWSKSQYLLSSSMDKTVRLWDMETKTCLKLFAHNDYVTCIQFNPVDDRYFISGSLDAKVRIWSIPDRQVVDWNDLHEMVTAACYTPDGQGALVGSHRGTCRLYSMSDSKLSQTAQLDLHYKKKKSQVKKITGFQFSSGNPSEVLITSADSQIRVVTGVDLIHKFRGFRNTSSQISATYSPDGNYVVCASEDSHVYLWKRGDSHCVRSHGKGKTWVTTHAHENFHCKDVSVAIPWPGSSRHEPPSIPSSSSSSTRFNRSQHTTSPDSQAPSASLVSSPEDPFASSRSHCPPLPKRTSPDQTMARADEENSGHSRSGSNISSSISSGSSSWLWSGPLSSISGFSLPSSALSSRWYTGGSNRVSASPAATAWGLVIVTAGLGGEIRVYQNFGLPLRLSR